MRAPRNGLPALKHSIVVAHPRLAGPKIFLCASDYVLVHRKEAWDVQDDPQALTKHGSDSVMRISRQAHGL